jgi:ornithine cyclodeaminase
LRQHFDIENPESERETTLLVMPSWQSGSDIGVKLVTVVPDSYKYDLPSIQGVYTLMDAVKGGVKAMIDAPSLTAKRTACASALASSLISKQDTSSMLMVGTGTLSPELIQAHCAVRPIKWVKVWGRSTEKAQAVIDKLLLLPSMAGVEFEVVTDLDSAVSEVDLISCATMSQTPLIKGQLLKPGQHLDMVGAYRPDMRDADDDCIRRCKVFVDNYKGALKETGDIKIPIDSGVMVSEDIIADLFELCKGDVDYIRNDSEITLFKSVGHALEDLAAAQLVVTELGIN